MLYSLINTETCFTHTEDAPVTTEIVEFHKDVKLILKSNLTARSSVADHSDLLKDLKCKCDSQKHNAGEVQLEWAKRKATESCSSVKQENVSTITAYADIDDLAMSFEQLTGFNPFIHSYSEKSFRYDGNSLGIRWYGPPSRFPGPHTADCTREMHLVTIKNKMTFQVSPLHIESLTYELPPSSESLTDSWRAPIIIDDVLLARFIYIAHLHHKKDTRGEQVNVRISCMRSSLSYAGCADLISLSIKQAKNWVHLTTQLNLSNE